MSKGFWEHYNELYDDKSVEASMMIGAIAGVVVGAILTQLLLGPQAGIVCGVIVAAAFGALLAGLVHKIVDVVLAAYRAHKSAEKLKPPRVNGIKNTDDRDSEL